VEAGYMAMQDGNAVINYFKANANKYDIDPKRIFIAGISAGGILALHAGHFNGSEDLMGLNKILDDKYGCYKCTGDNISLDNSVAGVISIVGGTTSPNILDDIPTLHIYTPTDSVVPANMGIPLKNVKTNIKPPNVVKKIINSIKRTTCFGPIYFKDHFSFKNHTYCDINALTNSICTHSFMTSKKGMPTTAGLKTLDLINDWLMNQLKPNVTLPKQNLKKSVPTVLNLPQPIVNHSASSNSNYKYLRISNTSFEIEPLNTNPGEFDIQIENDLGLKTFIRISSTLGEKKDEIGDGFEETKLSQRNNYLIYFLIIIALVLTYLIFNRYY